ncbi:MAG: shikimate dehydrogenase, partial [Deltaproteobacteria bacterium]|nr:shikimate dehydrogenase [Deltaproteobacteria bacterium]
RAKENNCTVISGNEMFIGQAAEQFRIFTGIEPDEAFMQEVLQ